MEVKKVVIPYTRPKSIFHLYLLGDLHAGTIHCVEDKIKLKVKEIKNDPFANWIGMGDYGEFITPDDKRFDPSLKAVPKWLEQDDIADCITDRVVGLLDPIRDKCIGLLYGNHEESYRTHKYGNVQKHICDDLKVDNLGFSCFVKFAFERGNERHSIQGCFTHGRSAAVTKGAKVNALRRFMNDFNARLYGYAHVHDIDYQRKPYLDTNNIDEIVDVESVGVLTGCWFRTYTQGIVASYGEKQVYPPTVIGCPKIIINLKENRITAET